MYLEARQGNPRFLVGLYAFRPNRTSTACTDGPATAFGATSVEPYIHWILCTVLGTECKL